jgi:WYL domain
LTKLATTRSTQSFNSRVRDECLNINVFWSLAQARTVISDWKEVRAPLWYVIAWDSRRNAPRLFRADRIRRPSVIEETFLPRPHALVTRVCPDARAAFGGGSNARRQRSARPG